MTEETFRRKNIRLYGYDYRDPGAYFITICSAGRRPIFGSIREGELHPSDAGQFVAAKWAGNEKHYAGLIVDEFIVMPNHLHGILILNDNPDRLPVGEIVRRFKSITTIRLHKERSLIGRIWQPNYFEHVIRNENDLRAAREYIATNVLRWELDRLNPDAVHADAPRLMLPGGLVRT